MAEGEEHRIAQTDNQEKEVARDEQEEKSAESENAVEGKRPNGDLSLKGRDEEVPNEVEVVMNDKEKDGGLENLKGMEENGDAKIEEEKQTDGGIEDEAEKGLGKEEIESKKIDEEILGLNQENEKKDEDGEEKHESKQEEEKKDSGFEENGELKKEVEGKNGGDDQENGESKEVDGKTNGSGDLENGASKKEDEIKDKGDGENGESDEKKNEDKTSDALSCNVDVNGSSLKKEEDSLFSELKENERMALKEIRIKLEEAIKENRLFKEEKSLGNDVKEKGKSREKFESIVEEANKMKEEGKKAEEFEKENEKQEEQGKREEEEEKEHEKQEEGGKREEEEKVDEKLEEQGEKEEENPAKDVEEKKTDEAIDEKTAVFLEDITLWGVPLLPSKGDKATDVLLLKFLRARDYKSNEAFEMLRNTLQWRKESNIDSVLNEDFANEFFSAAYMSGKDNEGHPVCYNIFGVLDNDDMYKKTLITEETRNRFLRWRVQLMEQGIQKLDFNPTGVSCLIQISDLKNTPGPSKKEVRLSARQGVSLFLDNYPELVAKHIFINVPFWYYAFTAVLSPFLTPRTKSKFIYARPSKVPETLLKYIAAEEIPIQYGGLKRENDSDFSTADTATEVSVKSGATESIEIRAAEAGSHIIWDVMVLGWEVNYKEEFVPDDEGSYGIVVQKGKKISTQEGSTRNSFENNEPGKVVISVENSTFKKKRVFYRYKIRSSSSSS